MNVLHIPGTALDIAGAGFVVTTADFPVFGIVNGTNGAENPKSSSPNAWETFEGMIPPVDTTLGGSSKGLSLLASLDQSEDKHIIRESIHPHIRPGVRDWPIKQSTNLGIAHIHQRHIPAPAALPPHTSTTGAARGFVAEPGAGLAGVISYTGGVTVLLAGT